MSNLNLYRLQAIRKLFKQTQFVQTLIIDSGKVGYQQRNFGPDDRKEYEEPGSFVGVK